MCRTCLRDPTKKQKNEKDVSMILLQDDATRKGCIDVYLTQNHSKPRYRAHEFLLATSSIQDYLEQHKKKTRKVEPLPWQSNSRIRSGV